MTAWTTKKESFGVFYFSPETLPQHIDPPSTLYGLDDHDLQCTKHVLSTPLNLQGEYSQAKTICDPFYVYMVRFIEEILIQVDCKESNESTNTITELALT